MPLLVFTSCPSTFFRPQETMPFKGLLISSRTDFAVALSVASVSGRNIW